MLRLRRVFRRTGSAVGGCQQAFPLVTFFRAVEVGRAPSVFLGDRLQHACVGGFPAVLRVFRVLCGTGGAVGGFEAAGLFVALFRAVKRVPVASVQSRAFPQDLAEGLPPVMCLPFRVLC